MDKVNIYNKFTSSKITDGVKKVSVIIPNYNYASFIVERIDSIINQTYPIYELIILDDCSKDNSVQIIKDKLATIGDIPSKIIVNDTNSGLVFSQWQKGISEVTGDYFWICEADDSADPTFLESVMRGFDNEKVVLSYSDSMRINDKNEIIRSNCQDLYNMFKCNHWNKDYINNGEDEIRNYLSVLNTILNVSGVVWKKLDNIIDIIEQAKNYKIAGDWYIYIKMLEKGDVAFTKQCLNYYRKHEGSVTSSIKADIEYQEIVKIQEMVAAKYSLSMDIYKWQRIRRNYMDANVSKTVRKKRIAWAIPFPGKGSGGHRTIIQNVNALIRHGYECDIYSEAPAEVDDATVAKLIDEYYETCGAKVYSGFYHREKYDLVVATGWQVLNYIKCMEAERFAYFIQDYEPWFFPVGNEYLMIEDSYRQGYSPITIGRWLSSIMENSFGLKTQHFDFCADLNVYKPLDNIKKENAICYVLQPEKPRRGTQLAIDTLRIVKEKRPDVKIYLYGSNVKVPIPFEAEEMGIIDVKECNKLYNRCKIGLCFSASNPSRIPFEMMAAGLPVIELYRQNNLYDLPEKGVMLAESSPASIATAILELIDDEGSLCAMSKFGPEYMKNYPLEKGFKQFVQAVDNLMGNVEVSDVNMEMLYLKKPIKATESFKKECQNILKPEIALPEVSAKQKMKGKIIYQLKRVYHKIKK